MTGHRSITLHASAVAINEKAVLLIGASGSGKSSLALQLIAIGATLVADDQCIVFLKDEALWVKRPTKLPPLIEARGVGLLKSAMSGPASVELVVNMDKFSGARLPETQFVELLGHQAKMIDKSDVTHFPSAVLLYVTHGIAT